MSAKTPATKIDTPRERTDRGLPVQSTEKLTEYSRQAAQARKTRAEFLAAIKGHKIAPSAALDQAFNDAVLQRIPVRSLIRAVPNVGDRTTEVIMSRVNIAPSRRVQGLGVRQRRELAQTLDRQPIHRDRA